MAFRPITTFAWPAMAALAAVLSSGQPVQAGGAAGGFTSYCVYSNGYEICGERRGDANGGIPRIIEVPAPQGERAIEADARERKWLARCRPVIKQDRYGVGRYAYARPGCEFGKSED
jgi:hypothetical protein